MKSKAKFWTGLGALTVVAVAAAAVGLKNPAPDMPLPSMAGAKLLSKATETPYMCNGGVAETTKRIYSLDHEGDLIAELAKECSAITGCSADANASGTTLDFRVLGSESSYHIYQGGNSEWIIESYTTKIQEQPAAPAQAWM